MYRLPLSPLSLRPKIILHIFISLELVSYQHVSNDWAGAVRCAEYFVCNTWYTTSYATRKKNVSYNTPGYTIYIHIIFFSIILLYETCLGLIEVFNLFFVLRNYETLTSRLLRTKYFVSFVFI